MTASARHLRTQSTPTRPAYLATLDAWSQAHLLFCCFCLSPSQIPSAPHTPAPHSVPHLAEHPLRSQDDTQSSTTLSTSSTSLHHNPSQRHSPSSANNISVSQPHTSRNRWLSGHCRAIDSIFGTESSCPNSRHSHASSASCTNPSPSPTIPPDSTPIHQPSQHPRQ